MAISEAYNMDCLAAMKQFPDKFFDLCVADPVYGDVTQGGYMKNAGHDKIGDFKTVYHTGLWQQEKTSTEYFSEMFRISKNLIICGGVITSQKL